MSNTLGTRPADFSFLYGSTGDRPFAGDFDGDGRDSVGFIATNGVIIHKNQLAPGPNDFGAYYGHTTHRLVAGDWDGDGDDTLGAYRPDGAITLWNGWALGTPAATVSLGAKRLPVAGAFDG